VANGRKDGYLSSLADCYPSQVKTWQLPSCSSRGDLNKGGQRYPPFSCCVQAEVDTLHSLVLLSEAESMHTTEGEMPR
jgi:hypothetical protein